MGWTQLRGWPLATAAVVSVSAVGLLVLGLVLSYAPDVIVAGAGLALLALAMWRSSRLAWQVAPIVAGMLFVMAVVAVVFITAGACSHPPCFPFFVYAIPLGIGLLGVGMTIGIVGALRPADQGRPGISWRAAAIGCLWLASAFLLAVTVWRAGEYENGLAGYLDFPLAGAIGLAIIAVAWTGGSTVARWLAGVAGIGGLLGSIGLAVLFLGAGCAIAAGYPSPTTQAALTNGGACIFIPIVLPLLGAGAVASIVVVLGVLRPVVKA